jgi:hypothetical protein
MPVSSEQESLVLHQGDERPVSDAFASEYDSGGITSDSSRGNREADFIQDVGGMKLPEKFWSTFQQNRLVPSSANYLHQRVHCGW